MVTHGAYGPPGSELQRLYDADAVDRYVGQLHAHIEELQRQVADAVRIAREAEARVAAAGSAEAALGRAMMTAQRSADGMIADAERRAELILADARLEADRLLGDVRADAQRIVDEAHETVEAVFSALTSAREQQAVAAPRPAMEEPAPAGYAPEEFAPAEPEELAPAAFAPAGTAPGGTAPGAPMPSWPAPGAAVPSWPAPDPAQRHVDDDESAVPPETSEPAVSASAAYEEDDDDDEGEGLIVDLRPVRGPHPGPQATHAGPAGNGDGGWSASLGGTGTEGVPGLDPAPAWRAAPEPAPGRPGSELLDRWRLARSGPSAFDDEFVSRQTEMDSLADGSWVARLRDDPAVSPMPTRDTWQPKPPPVGRPIEPPGAARRGLLGRRQR